MTGKVFVSCGQHLPREKEAAEKIRQLLRDEFGLTPYLAFRVQGPRDIMKITDELRSSDYYLFIDFRRRSLFTHQELALAQHLGFDEVIALQEDGAPASEGFLRYTQSNPEQFTMPELVSKVRNLVKDKKWTPSYSRNLVINPALTTSGGVFYGDHTGRTFHESWRAKIHNHRPDAAAVGAVCILDTILLPSGDRHACPDRGYLKWVGHSGYERTILPKSAEEVDVCAVRRDQRGLFLLSTLDVQPRQPISIVTEDGDYELSYKVFARDFPLLEFTVKFHLQWQQFAPVLWTHQSQASVA